MLKIEKFVVNKDILKERPRCYSEIIIYNYYDNDKHKISEALNGRYISELKKNELIEFITINELI